MSDEELLLQEHPLKKRRLNDTHEEIAFDIEKPIIPQLNTLYDERDLRIFLREEDHKYFLDGERQRMVGANECIDALWLSPFDQEKMLCNMTVDIRHKLYGTANTDLCKIKAEEPMRLGTSLHHAIEQHIKQECRETCETLLWKRLPEWEQFLQAKAQLEKEGWHFVRSEWVVFDEELQLAGSIDALMARVTTQHTLEFMIVDFKRAKPLVKETRNPDASRRMGRNAASDFCHSFRAQGGYWSYVGSCRYHLQLAIYAGILKRAYPTVGAHLTRSILLRFCDPEKNNRGEFSKSPAVPEIIPLPISDEFIDILFAERKELLALHLKIDNARTSIMCVPDVKRYHELTSTDGMPLDDFQLLRLAMSINAGGFLP